MEIAFWGIIAVVFLCIFICMFCGDENNCIDKKTEPKESGNAQKSAPNEPETEEVERSIGKAYKEYVDNIVFTDGSIVSVRYCEREESENGSLLRYFDVTDIKVRFQHSFRPPREMSRCLKRPSHIEPVFEIVDEVGTNQIQRISTECVGEKELEETYIEQVKVNDP